MVFPPSKHKSLCAVYISSRALSVCAPLPEHPLQYLLTSSPTRLAHVFISEPVSVNSLVIQFYLLWIKADQWNRLIFIRKPNLLPLYFFLTWVSLLFPFMSANSPNDLVRGLASSLSVNKDRFSSLSYYHISSLSDASSIPLTYPTRVQL